MNRMPQDTGVPEPEPRDGHGERLPVFVYGTLRPGEKNYPRYLGGRTSRERRGSVEGRLYFVAEGGYPYLLPEPGRVVGELVELQPEGYAATLAALDRLEEYDPRDEAGSVYLRRKTWVTFADGAVERAWVYYWNCPEIKGRLIASGDFRHRSEG